MLSKVWGELYPALFFSLGKFLHCGNKEIGKFFFLGINLEKHANKLENFSKSQKPQN